MSTGARWSQDKEINRILAGLQRRGWTVVTGKHPRVIAPNGDYAVFSYSPSDVNASRQFARDIRRIETNQGIHA
jgi:hypothetical protein